MEEKMPDRELDPTIWDENGMLLNPVYVNGDKPTTQFHPGELPAHPALRQSFPQELIAEDSDENWSVGLGDVAPVEERKARAARSAEEFGYASSPVATLAPPSEEAPPVNEGPPYAQWTNDELREELGARELDTHGVKSELVTRLEEDDRANPLP
jgi:hypothetical protein